MQADYVARLESNLSAHLWVNVCERRGSRFDIKPSVSFSALHLKTSMQLAKARHMTEEECTYIDNRQTNNEDALFAP